MTVFECCNDMFILDCGLAFPDMDMPGVDIVIPDFTYVEGNKDKIRGIVITHGHEDHIGGLAYLLKKINVPIYGTRMTLGLIEGKLEEHGLLKQAKLIEVEPRTTVRMGCMAVEFIKVNHSIPGAVGMAIHTPAGIIVHTGDFKVDFSPIDDEIIDLARFGELGSRGVLALMADSTNAERTGFTCSERTVGGSFEKAVQAGGGKANHYRYILLQCAPCTADHRSGKELQSKSSGVRPQHGACHRKGDGTGLSESAQGHYDRY